MPTWMLIGSRCALQFVPFVLRGGALLLYRWQTQVAYSGPSRPPIPAEADHPFRLIPTTDSGASRPPIPVDSDHRFRWKPTGWE